MATSPSEVVIEIGAVIPESKYLVKSFPLPLLQPAYYQVPLYSVSIFKAKDHRKPAGYTDKQGFKAVRFGVYDNDGSVKEYKAKGRFVVGLSDDKWYRLHTYKDYHLHSRPDNPDNGAWIIEDTHYIHSGPASLADIGYGTAGCVEIFGDKEFVRFAKVLMQYTGATSRYQVPKSAPVWIHVKHAGRPPIEPAKKP
jgi:hypothetical protein